MIDSLLFHRTYDEYFLKVQEGWLIIGQLSASYRHSTYINYWDGFSHKYTYVIKWKRENCGRFLLLFYFSYLRNLKISKCATLFQNFIFGLIVSIENIHPDFIDKHSLEYSNFFAKKPAFGGHLQVEMPKERNIKSRKII